MTHKHRVLVALGVATALAACAPSTSWARRVRTAASKKVTARPKPANSAPKKYLQMHVSAQQVYSNPVADRMFGSAESKEAKEAVKEKRGSLLLDFQTPLVHLSADDYFVDNEQIVLFGHATITFEASSQPLSISGEQLLLYWNRVAPPSDTVIEAQIQVGDIVQAPGGASGDFVTEEARADIAPAEKPSALRDTKIPLAAKPLSRLLRLLVDESGNNGRFLQDYAEGEKLTVSRYVVKFSGFSDSSDSGGYSESGQLIYDQRKRVLFLEARTAESRQNKSTLLQLTLADVTMARLSTLLREGHGAISYTKPTIGAELVKLGARLTKRSLTSSTYK